jgi:hypothetical protein
MDAGQPIRGSLTMKRLLALLVLLALGILLLALFLVGEYERGKTLAEEVFQLPEDAVTDFLSEEVALEYANRLLARRYPSVTWKPIEDDRSVAPDGTKDRYLLRNTINSSVQGSIVFTIVTPIDTIPNQVSARFTLHGRELTCVLSRTK